MSWSEEVIREHNLSAEEWSTVLEILGREPTLPELGIFSAMWSEHCSYKSSRIHLRTLPSEGPRVIEGPGENAGVVDIGDGLAVVFKMESHNHPSFIEPHQGAATGVGGILRDVFTMGARPIACLDPLFFGAIDAPRMRHLVRGVVEGIGGYGNCIGIPTVGGSTTFHPSYDGNILVNVMAVGIAPSDAIFTGLAGGPGNPILYVGARTGRDGIHGAKMASETFDEESEAKRPTVQVGDPFTEKLLLEACLELFRTDACVGIQDMGAAGLTSSTFEMAGRAGTGVRIDLSRVPMREEGMSPYELVLSESQERMVLVAEAGRESEVIEIFRKWDLEAVVLGEVTDTGRVEMLWDDEIVVDLPVGPLADRAPVYDRPRAEPEDREARNDGAWRELPDLFPTEVETALVDLLTSPALASKRWIWEQYDHMVRTNTVIRPGAPSAVLRVKESESDGVVKGIAVTADVNPVWCGLDPYQGARAAVAEAARNLACVGAEPIGLTDCLNFGSPEVPEIMWQFGEAVRGLGDAAREMQVPVVSGNVSFYNQTHDQAILPTPTVGMVGLLDDVEKAIDHRWKASGDVILLMSGGRAGDLGGSAFVSQIHGREIGPIPAVDLDHELRLGRLLRGLIAEGQLRSAQDVAEGGLLVALAECGFGSGLGAAIEFPELTGRMDALVFDETPGVVIASVSPVELEGVLERAAQSSVIVTRVGVVQEDRFQVAVGGTRVVDLAAGRLEQDWEEVLALEVDRSG